jgi:hypothetical protein
LKEKSLSESKTLEYKKELNLKSDSEKKEFLKDVSAFANTSGGDIIYGIAEKSAVPSSLDGIKVDDLDLLKQQIENLLRDGIEPRISGIQIKELEKQSGIYFLIIRIPKSWTSPHRVNIKDSKRFYARNSNGNYELEINELRRAFILTDSISTKLKSFREERVSRIISNETPIELEGEYKIALHIVPLISLNQSQIYDIKIVKNRPEYSKPLVSSGWDSSYNFDGIVSFTGFRGGKASSYTQFFKNGIIEAVTTNLILPDENNTFFLPSTIFEQNLFEGLRNYFSFYKAICVDYPVFVFVTLINYKGVHFAVDFTSRLAYNSSIIDRYILPIPEVLVESSQLNFHAILRPIFDILWNTCGFERCLHYDSDGNYKPN